MRKFKVATIVGSNRRESINRRLADALTRLGESEAFEFEFVRIDDLPMYSYDLEGARPPAVVRFTNEVAAADAALFVAPEHNRSIPAVLKNAIDWGSKPNDRNVWRGKPVAITGTSPGALGTAVGQQHLRQILGILGSWSWVAKPIFPSSRVSLTPMELFRMRAHANSSSGTLHNSCR
jgi:chromate reductase, NAD(P)H dehydrogenase (quinone)